VDFTPLVRRRHRTLSLLGTTLEKHGYKALLEKHRHAPS
jgi:hypothetical protein